MTLHSSFFILRSSLLLLLLAACTNDPTEDIVDVAPGTLPEGTFVIDYTASTGDASTRATAAERIRSLDYLLYESTDGTTFTLKHRRSIPDIGENTVWPLNRETMTWKQRQALKDTLNTACQYKMVFVANADAKLWDSQEVLQNVTEGSSTFDEGRLVLPTRVFTENDMYYMWSNHDAPLMGSEYSKDNPAQMDILLQRMINKVEVKLDDEVVSGITSAESVSDYVISFLDKYYDDYYFTEEQSGKLYEVVDGYMEGIATFTNDANQVVNPNEYTSKENFRNILKNTENKKNVAHSISKCENSYTDEGKTHTCCVKHQFIDEMKEQFIEYCDWASIASIDFTYSQTAYPYAIDFTMATKAEGTENNYTLNAPRTDNDSYIFYTFGNNADSSSGLNLITSAIFKNEEDEDICNTTVNIVPGGTTAQGNHHFLLRFDPTKVTMTGTFQFEKQSYNLQTVLNWEWDDFTYSGSSIGWQQSEMIKWVNSLFSGNENNSQFVPYTLTLNIPQIGLDNPWESELAQ